MINVLKRRIASFCCSAVNCLQPGPTARRVMASKLMVFSKRGRRLSARAVLFGDDLEILTTSLTDFFRKSSASAVEVENAFEIAASRASAMRTGSVFKMMDYLVSFSALSLSTDPKAILPIRDSRSTADSVSVMRVPGFK